MDQDEINERERNNPDNWGKRLGFYSSPVDSRLWVRRPHPWMSWSLNMAKPLARALLVLFTLSFCLLMVSIAFAVFHK